MRIIRTTYFLHFLILILLVLICLKFIFELQLKSSNISHVDKSSIPRTFFKATTSITTTTTKKTVKKIVKFVESVMPKNPTKPVEDKLEDTCIRDLNSKKGKIISSHALFDFT